MECFMTSSSFHSVIVFIQTPYGVNLSNPHFSRDGLASSDVVIKRRPELESNLVLPYAKRERGQARLLILCTVFRPLSLTASELAENMIHRTPLEVCLRRKECLTLSIKVRCPIGPPASRSRPGRCAKNTCCTSPNRRLPISER